MNELKEKIKDLIQEYKDKKVGNLNLNIDIDFEIQRETDNVTQIIIDRLEELDETIDDYVTDEPSDYELDCKADDLRHYENMIGG